MNESEPDPARAKPTARRPGLRYAARLSALRGSDTAKAAGLAGAMIANNVTALVATVVFAHEHLDYGSLGALISYLLILTVAGQAMQVATAREGVLGHLGVGPSLLATVRGWARTLAVATVVLTAASILLRHPIAQAVGVHRFPWAAALGIPTGCVYLQLCLMRGALQGVGDYRSVGASLVGEQLVRLITGATLALGLGVTGAYLGSILSYVAMSVYCLAMLRSYAARHVSEADPATAKISLGRHIWRAWAPIAGLIVIAVLQNIDIIAAKHRFSTATASSYAATAVAAKVLIWVAMGAGFYLVPEVSRRRAAGEPTRPVLGRALGIVLLCSLPCLLIYAFAAHPLLSAVFGHRKATASGSLLPLGAAFTVLACTYLAIQYMLGLKRVGFLVVLAAVAAVEPVLLLHASRHPESFATVVLAVQAAGALLAFGFALWAGGAHSARTQKSPSWESSPGSAVPASDRVDTPTGVLAAPTRAAPSSRASSSGS
jgi:O-antigen/teichoic acid export membrane protein